MSDMMAWNADATRMPYRMHAEYLRRLVGQGHRVAVCEQVEDPKLAKGLVKREVIETITPGAVFADHAAPGFGTHRMDQTHRVETEQQAQRDGPVNDGGLRRRGVFRHQIATISKSDFDTPQSGHSQSAGTSAHKVPAGMPSSGRPSASS